MAMISTLVWGCRKTGATIAGCTYDRDERQVKDRIVETGGRRCLVADSRIGCSRQKAAPAGTPFGDRWTAARYAPVLDFRIDLLSSGCHGEIGFGNGKGDGGRKLGVETPAGSYAESRLAAGEFVAEHSVFGTAVERTRSGISMPRHREKSYGNS